MVIKELGFANLSIGSMGILSLCHAGWSQPAAIVGGIFFGFAGLGHLTKRADSTNEIIAMISNLFVFALLLLYLCFTL